MLVIAIAGLPGSGKSTVARLLGELGFRVFVMGDYVRREAERMGISVDEAAVRIRLIHGPRIVARLVLNDILSSGAGKVAIEGLRSVDEYYTFREVLGDVKLIFVAASLQERFRRLSARGRPDDPRSINDLIARDYRELGFGLCGLMGLADYIIVNEGVGLDELRSRVKLIVDSLLKV